MSNEYPQPMFLWRNKKNMNTFGLIKNIISRAMTEAIPMNYHNRLCGEMRKYVNSFDLNMSYFELTRLCSSVGRSGPPLF